MAPTLSGLAIASNLRHAPIRVALVGLGRMGRNHLAAIRRFLPDIQLVAVVEPAPASLAAARAALGTAHIYPTAVQAMEHEQLDACLIITPTDTHIELVAAAVARGLHVFCEKPLTLDLKEAERLGAAARERDLILQVGFFRRFSPPFVKAKELLHQGSIGVPLFVRAAQWDVACPPTEWCDPKRSGGIFIDMGVHEFDQIEWLLDDEIVSVEGRALPLVKAELKTVNDLDNALVFIGLASQAGGLIDLSRNGRYADDVRLEILGSEGAIFVDTYPNARVRLGSRSGLQVVWDGGDEDSFILGVAAELAAFSLAITEPLAASVPGAAASIRATAIGQGVWESILLERPVQVRASRSEAQP